MTKKLHKRKQLLIDTLSVQTSSGQEEQMMRYIINFCITNVPSAKIEVDSNNIYVTKGSSDAYPCIVAHTDTVHDIHKSFKVYDDNNCLFAFSTDTGTQVGVGGDDKVGVWLALQMLLTQDIIKCAFFHSEEIGCVGSSQANMSWFKDVGYCLQGDRRGNTDFVNSISGELYSMCFAEDVAPIISKYGYKESSGAITDVGQLAENGIGVSVANMSCGYYAPHSDKEVVQFHDANNCLDMIMHIVNDLGCTTYKHVYKNAWQDSFDWGDFQGANRNYWFDDRNRESEVILDEYGDEACYYCNGKLKESEYGEEFRFCADCNSDVIVHCQEDYFDDYEDVSDNYDGSMAHRQIVNQHLLSHYKNK